MSEFRKFGDYEIKTSAITAVRFYVHRIGIYKEPTITINVVAVYLGGGNPIELTSEEDEEGAYTEFKQWWEEGEELQKERDAIHRARLDRVIEDIEDSEADNA